MRGLEAVRQGCAPEQPGAPAALSAIEAALLGLLRRAVREELAELELREPTPRPALVDRNRLARTLNVSVSSVDRLRAEGAPTVFVGEAPRFEPKAVIAWLRSRGGSK